MHQYYLLTFKEDEPAIMSLICSINVARETPPKVTDWHGVVIQNPVPTHTPEPAALRGHSTNVWLSFLSFQLALRTRS